MKKEEINSDSPWAKSYYHWQLIPENELPKYFKEQFQYWNVYFISITEEQYLEEKI